ncbi:hypothetical protein ABFS82_07G012400 [Erythranthe guttata]
MDYTLGMQSLREDVECSRTRVCLLCNLTSWIKMAADIINLNWTIFYERVLKVARSTDFSFRLKSRSTAGRLNSRLFWCMVMQSQMEYLWCELSLILNLWSLC